MVVATNPAGLHRYNNHKVATMKVSMYVQLASLTMMMKM